VLIDFTRPEGTLAHLAVCRELGVKGWSSAPPASPTRRRPRLPPAPSDIAIVMAPNMSVGVNVTLKLLEMAAKAAGHRLRHRDHRGPPPPQGRCALGTALKMGEVIAARWGVT
jgi:4-hydroxy-tetrahydrodipicolinate reductase